MAIEMIPALPDNVIGFIAKGTITSDDYTSTVDPAIDSALTKHDKIRLLYVLGADFEDFSLGAAREDSKLGIEHFSSFDRMAVVTDHDWIRRGVQLFGHLIPGQVKVYSVADEASASEWLTAPD